MHSCIDDMDMDLIRSLVRIIGVHVLRLICQTGMLVYW